MLLHTWFGTSISLDHFFDDKAVSLESEVGWVVIITTLVNSVVGAFLLFLVVERAKKCLDFAFTTHLLHLAACSFYDVSNSFCAGAHETGDADSYRGFRRDGNGGC